MTYNRSRYGGTTDIDIVEVPEEDFTEKVILREWLLRVVVTEGEVVEDDRYQGDSC